MGGSSLSIAREIFDLLGTGRSMPPITSHDPGFDPPAAYAVIDPLRRLREARGERVAGRKIGFTNQRTWELQGIDAPIWGYVYDTTLFDLESAPQPFRLERLVEPRIEPEIIFGLKSAPRAGMSTGELLRCCEWVSHGFEVVQSMFPNWKLTPADAIAAFGMHAALFVGARHPISGREVEWEAALATFEIDLLRDGQVQQQGRGANVLGSPLVALQHLVKLLAANPSMRALQAGEIVTSGTLTDAMPIAPGQTWSTQTSGIALGGSSLSFS